MNEYDLIARCSPYFNPRTDSSDTVLPRRSRRNLESSERNSETERRRSREPRRPMLVLERRSKHFHPVLSIFEAFPDHKLLGEDLHSKSILFQTDKRIPKSSPWALIFDTTKASTSDDHTEAPLSHRMSTSVSSSRPTASWPDEQMPPSTRSSLSDCLCLASTDPHFLLLDSSER